MINAFSDRVLKQQSSIITSHTDLLLTRLRREVGKSPEGKLDMAKYCSFAMLDIFADLIFGESFYGLEADNEHSWILGFILGAKFGSIKNSLSRWYSLDKIFGWGFFWS